MNDIDFEAIAEDPDEAFALRQKAYRIVLDRGPWMLSQSRASAKMRHTAESFREYRISSLALAHSTLAADARHKGLNTCPSSTPDCVAACVSTTGLHSVWPETIDSGRIRRTHYLFDHRQEAILQVIGELERECRNAIPGIQRVVCRLNQYSDLPFETPSWGCIPQLFNHRHYHEGCADALFWDYTAIQSRALNPKRPSNYHLTYSWKGRNAEKCFDVLNSGRNVAVPFAVPDEDGGGRFVGNRATLAPIPRKWNLLGQEFTCHDGDLENGDLRFLDPHSEGNSGIGYIVALRFKVPSHRRRLEGLKTSFIVSDWQ